MDELPDVRDLPLRLAAEEESGDQQRGADGRAGGSDETPPDRAAAPDDRRSGMPLRSCDPFREAAVGRFCIEAGVGQVPPAPCVVGLEVAVAVLLRRAEPVEEFGLLGIGKALAVEVAGDQSVDMSVLRVHLPYSRIRGPNPYLSGRKKIALRPKRNGEPQPLPQLPAVSVPDGPRYR